MSQNQLLEALEYPFNLSTIMTKRAQIVGELSKLKGIEKRVAVLGESNTSELVRLLDLFLQKNNIKPVFFESNYGQGRQDILSNNVELLKFKPDIVYIHSNYFNIRQWPKYSDAPEQIERLVSNEFESFRTVWDKIGTSLKCLVIQNNFEPSPYRPLGNLDFAHHSGSINFINAINQKIANYAQQNSNFIVNDINYQASLLGLDKWFDFNLWYRSKYAMSFAALTLVAHNIGNMLSSHWGLTKRCLVLDLDNTLWGGVIGDDGQTGIEIGPDSVKGQAHQDFQRYIRKLSERGISLAIASKNSLESAKLGLSHPHSILKHEDFASVQANWGPKSDSIQQISKEVSLGFDSLLFIDDNPAEREIIHQFLPNVATPNVGRNIADYALKIDRAGFFEASKLESEDTNRNQFYADNVQREEHKLQFDSYLDYLKSLEMSAILAKFDQENISRIFQLINKTNQFNLTSRRYNMESVQNCIGSSNTIAIYGRLLDKFGDNGIVSVIVGHILEGVCHIDINLMSCRVLNRQMEFAMLDQLIEFCKTQKIRTVIGEYIESDRNKLVENFYESAGFQLDRRSQNTSFWSLDVSQHQSKNQAIKVSIV
ncbi:MAG: HAD-IIIC family phosphatase [Proteobacteria bacterium]|nr:HAD-IIIC family phosphatase [Pseudomonadota bacterium]